MLLQLLQDRIPGGAAAPVFHFMFSDQGCARERVAAV